MELTNKVALVTGSTRGIGLAIAKNFLKGGAKVILNGRSEELAPEVKAQLEGEYAMSVAI